MLDILIDSGRRAILVNYLPYYPDLNVFSFQEIVFRYYTVFPPEGLFSCIMNDTLHSGVEPPFEDCCSFCGGSASPIFLN